MCRALIISILLFLTSAISHSQILKGRITNESDDPVPYSTVFVQELRQGTTANTKGDYELKLPLGKYLVIFQSLGYSPVFYDITIKEGTETMDVRLPVQYYEIPEVRISASGEDPAYNIMRKVIGMAPYYLNHISSYKAEVYIKGNLVFKRIPKIVQRSIRMESGKTDSPESSPVKEGEVYMMETFNEIEFNAPDKYHQRVISVNNTFPDQDDNVSPMDIVQASFYQPVIADIAISPLSPRAFSYYRFKYLGATPQGNNTVCKIQVIPRMKSQQLFEGTIYILEDLWCLHSLDLKNNNLAGKISIQQLYIPVEEDTWMPVSLKFEMEISMFGIRGNSSYGTSMKYSAVVQNKLLKKPGLAVESASSAVSPSGQENKVPASKQQEKIEMILQKNELTNRDMIIMARLMNRETRDKSHDSIKKDLEVRNNTTRIIEKNAAEKDSAYWAEIRPIPLSDGELKSIRIRDSINDRKLMMVREIPKDSTPQDQSKKKSRFAASLRKVTSGHIWSDTSGLSFSYGGLIDTDNLRFNPVDGFVYGLDFRLSKNFRNSGSFYIAPETDYAFSREKLMWRINSGYSFKQKGTGSVYLRTGSISNDISTGGSINSVLNSITSLFLKKNYLKLYESNYIYTGFRSEIVNGFRIDFSAGYDNRKVLKNNSGFSFFRKSEEYAPNIPDNIFLAKGSDPFHWLYDQKHYEFSANFSWIPRQKYRMNNGIKIPWGSDWPEFNLQWKHGINSYTTPAEVYRHFDMIRFEASKTHESGAFSEFRWHFRTGGFLDNKYVPFYDFFHFNSQPIRFLLNDYLDVFYLPGYYSLSTPEPFGAVNMKYTTPYLLLKYLPGISKTFIRENIHLSWLGSRNNPHYTEIGYSLTEIFLLGEAGIYAGFDDLRFRNSGFRIILKFN